MNPRSDQPSHRVRTFVHPLIICERQTLSSRVAVTQREKSHGTRERVRSVSRDAHRTACPAAFLLGTRIDTAHHMLRKTLLLCGVLSSVFYVAMNIYVAAHAEGYSAISQTVSELSAIDAPTRPLWMPLGFLYGVLVLAFGFGVWLSSGRNRRLRIAGALLIANAVFGFFWPPMHLRPVLAGGGGTLSDTLHIAWTFVSGVLMMTAIGFAATAFGQRFRAYSIGTIVLLIGFGVVTGMDAPNLQANLPTPWIGLWERIDMSFSLLWDVAVFAAERTADGALTVMVLNKYLTGTTPVTLNLAGFQASGTAAVWQLAANAITSLGTVAFSGTTLTQSLPPQSVTLFVFPKATAPPPQPTLAAPANLSATATKTGVSLRWTDASTNETAFFVERRLSRQAWMRIATVTANVTTYFDGVGKGTYDYRVQAFDATSGAVSAYSNQVTVRVR